MSDKVARPSREAFQSYYQMRTRWGDHDSYGHVNNVTYYSYCESAISEFLMEQGALDIDNSPVIGLIVNSSCTYFSPISFPDRVDVGVRISRLGNSSARYELAMFRNDEKSAAAAAHVVYVYVDRASNVSVPIPAQVRDVLATLTD